MGTPAEVGLHRASGVMGLASDSLHFSQPLMPVLSCPILSPWQASCLSVLRCCAATTGLICINAMPLKRAFTTHRLLHFYFSLQLTSTSHNPTRITKRIDCKAGSIWGVL